jgi:hypothetical protein
MTGDKRCSKCGKTKAATTFNRHSWKSSGLYSWCKDCCRQIAAAYRAHYRANPSKPLTKKQCPSCGKVKSRAAFYLQPSNPSGLYAYCKSCSQERTRRDSRRLYLRLRLKVLGHYSRGIPHCACCGEQTLEFLALDHTNGNGNEHRRSIAKNHKGGADTYHWVVRNSFPSGFRVLCHNCNMAIGFYGACPHTRAEVKRA